MHTPTLHRNGTIDPAEAIRSARDQAPDARELLRGLDAVPARVDTALSTAGDTIREAGDQLRGTIHELSAPRRERRLPIAWPWLVGLAAAMTVIGVGAWWFRRSSGDGHRGHRPVHARPRRRGSGDRRGHGHGPRRDGWTGDADQRVVGGAHRRRLRPLIAPQPGRQPWTHRTT